MLLGAWRTRPVEYPGASLRALMRAMAGVPVVLTGRRCDVLAWNRLGHALFAGHVDVEAPEQPRERPDIARMIFTDAHTRSLYVDWRSKAKAVVEHLRLMAGRCPTDLLLVALVGELAVRSQDFTRLWASHEVHACDTATYELRHPSVGAVTVTQQSVTATAAPDQFLAVATTEPGSSSEAALLLLAQLAE
ncbi:hypothetical protein [Streptomyces sp. NPDC091389]|uniref:MmyB family transcriptional regulator n=1 Tax=Streptomyces sp. NPDC091389 TaxID=3365999 RepID=UPI003823FBA7